MSPRGRVCKSFQICHRTMFSWRAIALPKGAQYEAQGRWLAKKAQISHHRRAVSGFSSPEGLCPVSYCSSLKAASLPAVILKYETRTWRHSFPQLLPQHKNISRGLCATAGSVRVTNFQTCSDFPSGREIWSSVSWAHMSMVFWGLCIAIPRKMKQHLTKMINYLSIFLAVFTISLR